MASTWQWRDDSGVFKNFKPADSAVLEKSWTSGSTSLELGQGKQKYLVQFDFLTQTNQATKKERMIRRLGPSGGVLGKCPVWQWESSPGVFTPYEMSISDAIEKSFMADDLTCKVSLPTSAHDTVEMTIHFGHMQQINKATEGVRNIRRVVIKVDTTKAADEGDIENDAQTRQTKLTGKRGREVTATATAVEPATSKGSAFAPSAEKLTPVSKVSVASWQMFRSCLFLNHATSEDLAAPVLKVAGFDMDDTLVFPVSGATFAKGRNDWKWLHPAVPAKLVQLRKEGYRIVIFSNQSGIGNKAWDEGKATEIKGKIIDLGNSAGIPISAVVATKEDDLRKPGTGMWKLFLEKMSGGVPVDVTSSFYVGDAAGRKIVTMAGRKKDFSCSDRKFAYNIPLRFFTPEMFFLGKPDVEFDWDGLGPEDLKKLKRKYDHNLLRSDSKQEMVVTVGFPGSGKSTLYGRIFAPAGYVHINRDTLKTPEKCVEAAAKAVAEGKNVFVDNTSPSTEERKRYLAIAKKHGLPVRCLVMDVPHKLAFHMNIVRARLGITPRISSIAYNMYKSKFTEPSKAEGFEEIVLVPLAVDFTGMPPEAESIFFELS